MRPLNRCEYIIAAMQLHRTLTRNYKDPSTLIMEVRLQTSSIVSRTCSVKTSASVLSLRLLGYNPHIPHKSPPVLAPTTQKLYKFIAFRQSLWLWPCYLTNYKLLQQGCGALSFYAIQNELFSKRSFQNDVHYAPVINKYIIRLYLSLNYSLTLHYCVIPLITSKDKTA